MRTTLPEGSRNAVAHAPGLGCRLLEHIGARGPDLLERGVEVIAEIVTVM